MNRYIIFDNGGVTADRFTIVKSETGDVFGSGENPAGPSGMGKWIGNCAAHRTVLVGCGWRQRQSTKKIIKAETENYVNNARLDAEWIGREVDFETLPEKVREFISGLDADTQDDSHRPFLSLSNDSIKEVPVSSPDRIFTLT